jgi:MFS family permease
VFRGFFGKSSFVRKDFFIVSILLFNAFTWYYMTPIVLDSLLNDFNVTYEQEFVIWAAYFVALIGSSVVGSILSNKINRLNFLFSWMILGVVTSSLPALFNNFTMMHVLTISVLLGFSFGLGMPSCLAYFADCTVIENRGKISGVILLITNLSAPLFAISLSMLNLTLISIILVVWRGSGLVIFFLKPEEKVVSEMKRNVSFISILQNRAFILYFIAWLMFCLVDRFEWPILRYFFGDFYDLMLMIGPIIGSLSALIAGLLCDWVGRKRMVLYGFVALGIAYAVIGIAPAAVFAWYFHLIIDSISTGILMVTFWLILWADLSKPGTREKYYVIGEAPLFLTSLVQLLSASHVMLIPETSAFSVAAFFLFLAVFPLLYAPETLPEKKIKLRQLRTYVEKAKKVREKYVEKDV